MTEEVSIEVVVDSSLYDHFQENLDRLNSTATPRKEITRLLEIILNGSEFPVEARITGSGQIKVGYHLRSFSQPLF